jgi:hypothetical protein
MYAYTLWRVNQIRICGSEFGRAGGGQTLEGWGLGVVQTMLLLQLMLYASEVLSIQAKKSRGTVGFAKPCRPTPFLRHSTGWTVQEDEYSGWLFLDSHWTPTGLYAFRECLCCQVSLMFELLLPGFVNVRECLCCQVSLFMVYQVSGFVYNTDISQPGVERGPRPGSV